MKKRGSEVENRKEVVEKSGERVLFVAGEEGMVLQCSVQRDSEMRSYAPSKK